MMRFAWVLVSVVLLIRGFVWKAEGGTVNSVSSTVCFAAVLVIVAIISYIESEK